MRSIVDVVFAGYANFDIDLGYKNWGKGAFRPCVHFLDNQEHCNYTTSWLTLHDF